MEFVGFKQCMEYLIGYGLLMTIFISDCHVSIASHMKKVLKNIAITSTSDIWRKVSLSIDMKYCIGRDLDEF